MFIISPVVRRLWVLVSLNAVVIPALLVAVAGQPTRDTVWHPLNMLLHGRQQDDSWRAMREASAYLASPHAVPVYTALFDERGVKFQYPVLSLPLVGVLNTHELAIASQAGVLVLLVVVYAIARRRWAFTPLALDGPVWLTAGLFAALGLTFYPLTDAYALGQIQTFVNALLGCAVLAWIAKRDGTAGVLIGVATLLKPTYALLGLWGLARGRWRFLAALASILAIGAAASIAVWGWRDTADYLTALRRMSAGEAYFPNQSINGLLNRLVGNAYSLTFTRSAFAPDNGIVESGTIAGGIALAALAIWLPQRSTSKGGVLDLGIMLVTTTAVSPIAWTHHYGVLLPVFAASLPEVLAAGRDARRTALAFAGIYLLSSQSLTVTNRFAHTALAVLQSYVLLAALAWLALAYRALRPTHVGRTAALARAAKAG